MVLPTLLYKNIFSIVLILINTMKKWIFIHKSLSFLSIQWIVIFSLPQTGHIICHGGTFFLNPILNKLNYLEQSLHLHSAIFTISPPFHKIHPPAHLNLLRDVYSFFPLYAINISTIFTFKAYIRNHYKCITTTLWAYHFFFFLNL